jgi:hypothetical protein
MQSTWEVVSLEEQVRRMTLKWELVSDVGSGYYWRKTVAYPGILFGVGFKKFR